MGFFFLHFVSHQDSGLQSGGWGSTNHLFDHEIATMIVSANSPRRHVGRQGAHAAHRLGYFGQGMTRAALHRARCWRGLRPAAQDPVPPHRQLPGQGHRGHRPVLPLRQPQVLPAQFGIVSHRRVHCLDQQGPCLLIAPSRCRPPLEDSRGIRPK